MGAGMDIVFGKGEAKELTPPRDVAVGRYALGIRRILEAVYQADKLCAEGMVRAAEEKLKELGEEERALVKFVVSAAGEKLGLRCGRALL